MTTRGPWNWNVLPPDQAKGGYNKLVASQSGPVAICQQIDDAMLIAAAPDLLKACKAVAGNLDRQTGADYLIHITVMDRILAAIARAEGK